MTSFTGKSLLNQTWLPKKKEMTLKDTKDVIVQLLKNGKKKGEIAKF